MSDPLTILFVEDKWLIRNDVAEFMKAEGYEVIEAQSGEEALECLANGFSIGLVFTDIRLGGKITGWDIAEAGRMIDPSLKVIYASGAVIRPRREVIGSIFIEKPYAPELVLATIRRLLADPRS